MTEPDKKSLYAIIRIPKSGSSSMAQIIRDAFPDAAEFHLPHSYHGDWQIGLLDRLRFFRQEKKTLMKRHGTLSLDSAFRRIKTESSDGDIVGGGHISLRTFRRLGVQLKPITLLRHPARRLISEYNYNRTQIRKRTFLSQFDSAFSKKAATRMDLDRYLSLMLEHKTHVGNIASQLLDIEGRDQIPNRLQSDLFHFGVLENMAGFVDGLAEKSGRPLTAVTRNVTEDRTVDAADQIDRQTMAKIEELNDLDFELYEGARDLSR